MTRAGPDRRPTLTVKGAEFTPEFRALVNKAAKRSNMTQAAFVAEALAAAARRVLAGGGTPPGGAGGDAGEIPVPATVQQLADLQAAIAAIEARAAASAEATGAALDEIRARLEAAPPAAPRGGVLGRIWRR